MKDNLLPPPPPASAAVESNQQSTKNPNKEQAVKNINELMS